MGAKRGGGEELASESSMAPSLLFATMCLIGLPVEVQVTDGSIFSGVFHTARLELGYGVVLKKARKIVRGKSETNLPLGAFVDTLVILSSDLVQVVVKDFVLPAEGIVGSVNRNEVETASEVLDSGVCNDGLGQSSGKMVIRSNTTLRQVSKDRLQEVVGSSEHNFELPVVETMAHMQCSTQVDAYISQANSPSGNCVEISSKVPNESGSVLPRSRPSTQEGSEKNSLTVANSPPLDCLNSTATFLSVSCVDSKLSLFPGQLASSNPPSTTSNLVGHASVKEFKLNPEAKLFTPSSRNAGPAPTERPTLANACYSDIPPVVLMAGTQPGAELNSFTSPPTMLTKFIQYNNLVAGPSGFGQYSGPIAASIRQPSGRFGSQCPPLQCRPTYVHPNSQSVMVSRLGQLAYAPPISRDVIQGTAALPEGLPHPILTPYQAHAPKFQGIAAHPLPLCVTPSPPLIASVNQPFLMPNQTHISHPFPSVRPIPLSGANGIFVSKFH